MPSDSATYKLFARAIIELKQIVCVYLGHRRELCPTILGHSLNGDEKALIYQFAGSSGSALPPGGAWRCLFLSKVTEVALRDGPWHTGVSHQKPHSCVDIVDLDVNPDSPYSPKRPLRPERKSPAKKPAGRRPRHKA
jgi:hypothetical protein